MHLGARAQPSPARRKTADPGPAPPAASRPDTTPSGGENRAFCCHHRHVTPLPERAPSPPHLVAEGGFPGGGQVAGGGSGGILGEPAAGHTCLPLSGSPWALGVGGRRRATRPEEGWLGGQRNSLPLSGRVGEASGRPGSLDATCGARLFGEAPSGEEPPAESRGCASSAVAAAAGDSPSLPARSPRTGGGEARAEAPAGKRRSAGRPGPGWSGVHAQSASLLLLSGSARSKAAGFAGGRQATPGFRAEGRLGEPAAEGGKGPELPAPPPAPPSAAKGPNRKRTSAGNPGRGFAVGGDGPQAGRPASLCRARPRSFPPDSFCKRLGWLRGFKPGLSHPPPPQRLLSSP